MPYRKQTRDCMKRSAVNRWNSTTKLKDDLIAFSKVATFIDSEGNEKKFKSYAEFQEFVFLILLSRGYEGWNMLANQKLKPVFF